MSRHALAEGLRGLPAGDRRLLRYLGAAALVALVLGVLLGAATGLARGGFLSLGPLDGYRALTGHAVSIFFYWLYFAQAALLLAFAGAHGDPKCGIALRPLS